MLGGGKGLLPDAGWESRALGITKPESFSSQNLAAVPQISSVQAHPSQVLCWGALMWFTAPLNSTAAGSEPEVWASCLSFSYTNTSKGLIMLVK